MEDFTEKQMQFLHLTKTNYGYMDSHSMGLTIYMTQWPNTFISNIDIGADENSFDLRPSKRWSLVYDMPSGKRVVRYVQDEIMKSEVGNYIIKEFANQNMDEYLKILYGQPTPRLN